MRSPVDIIQKVKRQVLKCFDNHRRNLHRRGNLTTPSKPFAIFNNRGNNTFSKSFPTCSNSCIAPHEVVAQERFFLIEGSKHKGEVGYHFILIHKKSFKLSFQKALGPINGCIIRGRRLSLSGGSLNTRRRSLACARQKVLQDKGFFLVVWFFVRSTSSHSWQTSLEHR